MHRTPPIIRSRIPLRNGKERASPVKTPLFAPPKTSHYVVRTPEQPPRLPLVLNPGPEEKHDGTELLNPKSHPVPESPAPPSLSRVALSSSSPSSASSSSISAAHSIMNPRNGSVSSDDDENTQEVLLQEVRASMKNQAREALDRGKKKLDVTLKAHLDNLSAEGASLKKEAQQQWREYLKKSLDSALFMHSLNKPSAPDEHTQEKLSTPVKTEPAFSVTPNTLAPEKLPQTSFEYSDYDFLADDLPPVTMEQKEERHEQPDKKTHQPKPDSVLQEATDEETEASPRRKAKKSSKPKPEPSSSSGSSEEEAPSRSAKKKAKKESKKNPKKKRTPKTPSSDEESTTAAPESPKPRAYGKAVIGVLPDYNGEDARVPLLSFRRALTTAQACNSWDEQTTCRHLVAHLKGPAEAYASNNWLVHKKWYKIPWETRVDELEQQFGNPTRLKKRELARRARERVQKPDETVAAYASYLRDAAQLAELDEEDQIGLFIDGLQSHEVKTQLRIEDPVTWEEAVSVARRVEDACSHSDRSIHVFPTRTPSVPHGGQSRYSQQPRRVAVLAQPQPGAEADTEPEEEDPAKPHPEVAELHTILRALSLKLDQSEQRRTEDKKEAERIMQTAINSAKPQVCLACGTNHDPGDCPAVRQTHAPELTPTRPALICYNCNKPGHFASNCSAPRKPRFGARTGRTQDTRRYRPQPSGNGH